MIIIAMRRVVVAIAMVAMLFIAVDAQAACCGGGMTSAYYPSSYNTYYAGSYSAYYPTAYQSTGWYPGYYWNRMRARLWGAPTTYVAAYPTTAYYASAPSYSVSYAPTYAATTYAAPVSSTCSTCTAGYAPAAPSCSTCGVQTVTMRPVCATACASPCSTCSACDASCPTCAVSTVAQTSYVQQQPQQPCTNCPAAQSQQLSSPPANTPEPATPQTFDQSLLNNSASNSTTPSESAPAIDPNATVPTERVEKPATNGQDLQPIPVDETSTETIETEEGQFYKQKSSDSSTFFEAPALHDPNDRTAQRSIAPVRQALYEQQVGYRKVSTTRITAEQARQDAIGWSSSAR